jgi:DNA-binding MarR family transcriptional regulator
MPEPGQQDQEDGGERGAGRGSLLTAIEAIETRLAWQALAEQPAGLYERDFTVQQFRALLLLRANDANAGMSTHAFAEALGIQPNVATGIIQRLASRGLIHREEDPHDLRVRRLTLTPVANEMIDEIHQVPLEHRRRLLSYLSDDQLATLLELLEVIAAGAARDAAPARS